MSTGGNAPQEHPSTYVVQDRSNKEELIRLNFQDQMLTTSMGGVLPEQSDPAAFESVLDVACGTGAWLIEAAKTYPTMSLLVGADISKRMVEYAATNGQDFSDNLARSSRKPLLEPHDFHASITYLRNRQF
jgi:SAM-dependent methyltransferase